VLASRACRWWRCAPRCDAGACRRRFNWGAAGAAPQRSAAVRGHVEVARRRIGADPFRRPRPGLLTEQDSIEVLVPVVGHDDTGR
jgi:hypothetical protein